MSKPDDLRARHRWFTNAAIVLAGSAFVALTLVLVHVETGAGANMRDIHVPVDWLRGRAHALPWGEPYDVGLGWAKVVQWLTVACIAGLGCVGVWAAQTRKIAEKWRNSTALILVLLAVLFMPVPKLVVMGVAKGVSVESAERLLRTPQTGYIRLGSRTSAKVEAYIRAQIAYVRGDREGARRLASALDASGLASPIEAPYRLQYLQGQYRGLTTVCFIRAGCLTEPARSVRHDVALALTLVLAAVALLCAAMGWMLRTRLMRIDELAAIAASLRVRRTNYATGG